MGKIFKNVTILLKQNNEEIRRRLCEAPMNNRMKPLKLLSWLLESRRPLHLAAGLAIATITALLCVLLQCSNTATAVITLWTTLIAALSAEYKDYDHGDKFDLLDVLATIIPAIITSIVIML